MYTIQIKNMVCPRCILVVQNILEELHLETIEIDLGLIRLAHQPDEVRYRKLIECLDQVGLQIIKDQTEDLVIRIKTSLIKCLDEQTSNKNISQILSEDLCRNYQYLSRIFSQAEGMTIQEYWIMLKIDMAKQLLLEKNHTITEVAELLGYSSSAHFSVQFKKEMKMSPRSYRQLSHK
jgi:AraC-like DNA-binding protein